MRKLIVCLLNAAMCILGLLGYACYIATAKMAKAACIVTDDQVFYEDVQIVEDEINKSLKELWES